MRTWEQIKLANRHGAPYLLLGLLIWIACMGRNVVRFGAAFYGNEKPTEIAVAARFSVLDYVDQNTWLWISYLILFVLCIVWAQRRKISRLSLDAAFVLLVLPLVSYIWICVRLLMKIY
jgi:hypothetical protein